MVAKRAIGQRCFGSRIANCDGIQPQNATHGDEGTMQFWFGKSILAALMLAPSSPVFAASTQSCQQALTIEDGADAADAPASAGNPFGSHIQEIDGAKLTTPKALLAAIKAVKGKTPLVNGGNFAGWNFGALKSLPATCFFTSDLQKTNWGKGNFTGIGFVKANLEGAQFLQTRLDAVLLRESNLKDVKMTAAVLSGGLLDGGWDGSLENWDASGADMRGFRFSCGITIGDGCPLDRNNVTFAGADLRGSDLVSYNFWGQADYRGAKLETAKLSPRHLVDVKGADFGTGFFLVGGDQSARLSAVEITQVMDSAALAKVQNDQPSFLCAKASTPVEKMICGEDSYDLPALDRKMAMLYAAVSPKNPGLAADQKKWLASRAQCADVNCLWERYNARIDGLTKMLGEPAFLRPGETALYYVEQIDFPGAFKKTALFNRLTPVFVGASMGEVLVSRKADGSYWIGGESIGANAHLCSANGDNLRFDKKTGWFSGPNMDDKAKLAAVFRVFGDEIRFPGDGHPDDAEFPGSENYAGCGMRAMLVPMQRIEVDAAMIAKKRAIYSEMP